MSYLETYLQNIRKKNPAFAKSIKKTAEDISDKYLSSFDFNSHRMGLLFGNVQSGKTGHVFGVMCKAVELGFQFFIMLTTDNIALQEQTYDRAKRDLEDKNDFIVCSEGDEQKFRNHGNHPVVVVLKKNSRILKEWANKFKNIDDLKGNPLFIVDDEADASSLNTKINKKQISTINKYLREIRDISQSSIYLQMTGTPQSILLQSEESGWKPMFTYYFAPGKGYLGGNFFFPINDEVPKFVKFIDSNKNADDDDIAYRVIVRHLVVSAQLFLSGAHVSNCLIHPSSRQDIHQKVRHQFDTEFSKICFNHSREYFKKDLRKEYDSISPEKSDKQPYSSIESKVMQMLEKHDYNIVVLNSTSSDNSSECKKGCNFIIGGNSLGRGVTFDQLNTFYYTRSTKTPQADTMWQQSRIFGYDRDKGMISLFITKELYNLFVQINYTNDEIIKQIEIRKRPSISYPEGLRPTRMNVLDKSLLNILVGGSSYFPANPVNNTFAEITDMLKNFKDDEEPVQVPMKLLIEILNHFETDRNFDIKGYKAMMQTQLNKDPLAKGMIMARRNRNISYGKRALLSPNDWQTAKAFKKYFVLTLYQINGHDPKLNWPDKKDLWVPNIKLPGLKNFYVI